MQNSLKEPKLFYQDGYVLGPQLCLLIVESYRQATGETKELLGELVAKMEEAKHATQRLANVG